MTPPYGHAMAYPTPHVWHAGTDLVGGRPVKRYHLGREGVPISPVIEDRAGALIPAMFAPDDGTPQVAFTTLFRSGAGSHLNVYSWYWDNVIHARFAGGGVPFLGCPDDNPENLVMLDLPVAGCVYELSVLIHERSAWIRHMLMPDTPDLDAYLADTFSPGPAGLP